MASQLPARLRTAEIQRFATRAAQLEKFRPIVTYWCEYYILQQVLNKNLHTTDEECANYAVLLMDKLEKTKSENASNDAIIDDVAAKAYIENFALETFSRADDAQRVNKVTKQTADTFMAAATFLDLLSIWGELDAEASAKSKFAKFHALRIAKAFKAGEDPNATNPVMEEPPAPAEDGIDAEMRDLEHQQNGQESGIYRPPTVDSEVGSRLPSRPGSTVHGGIGSPPPVSQQQDHEVSPIEPPESTDGRQNSLGGGYFPTVSSQAPNVDMMDTGQPPTMVSQAPVDPQDFYNTSAPPPSAPSTGAFGMTSPHGLPPDHMAATPPIASPMQAPPVPRTYAQPSIVPAPTRAPVQPAQPVYSYKNDDESTMAAQKHARWAISALNFEDVNTAVKELRLALQSLGAG